jgi:hypothetical protein
VENFLHDKSFKMIRTPQYCPGLQRSFMDQGRLLARRSLLFWRYFIMRTGGSKQAVQDLVVMCWCIVVEFLLEARIALIRCDCKTIVLAALDLQRQLRMQACHAHAFLFSVDFGYTTNHTTRDSCRCVYFLLLCAG